jgi:hypothetical protein
MLCKVYVSRVYKTCLTFFGYLGRRPIAQSSYYEEDFSTEPNFTSYSQTNAYWDENNGNYYVKTKDDLNDTYWASSPQFNLVNSTEPVLIEFDVSFENQNFGTYPSVRFYDSEPTTEINPRQRATSFYIDNAYRNSYVRQIGIYDSNGNSYYTPEVSNGLWYRISITTNGSGKADIKVINIDSGSVIFEQIAGNFVITNFSYLGLGFYDQPNYGNAWSPIRIDNVKITSPDLALVAHYEFENNANDSSGNGFNGVASNVSYEAFIHGLGVKVQNSILEYYKLL